MKRFTRHLAWCLACVAGALVTLGCTHDRQRVLDPDGAPDYRAIREWQTEKPRTVSPNNLPPNTTYDPATGTYRQTEPCRVIRLHEDGVWG